MTFGGEYGFPLKIMQITSNFSPNFSIKICSKPQNLDSREEDAEDSRSPNWHSNRRRPKNGDWWVRWLRRRCLFLRGCHRWVCCSTLLFTLYGIVRFNLCGISNQPFHFQSFETSLTLDIPRYKVCERKKVWSFICYSTYQVYDDVCSMGHWSMIPWLILT